jgi:hypothetical protein
MSRIKEYLNNGDTVAYETWINWVKTQWPSLSVRDIHADDPEPTDECNECGHPVRDHGGGKSPCFGVDIITEDLYDCNCEWFAKE